MDKEAFKDSENIFKTVVLKSCHRPSGFIFQEKRRRPLLLKCNNKTREAQTIYCNNTILLCAAHSDRLSRVLTLSGDVAACPQFAGHFILFLSVRKNARLVAPPVSQRYCICRRREHSVQSEVIHVAKKKDFSSNFLQLWRQNNLKITRGNCVGMLSFGNLVDYVSQLQFKAGRR